jgi:AcrR family transcriptional regulator
MGRPRLHDEHTREALLVAAERLVAEGGVDAVGVRAVADGAGTSTRAVYALFGSKDELVQALAQRAFELVMEQVAAVPLTDDPGADLVACAVTGFRRFALDHPDLFRLFFTAQRQALSADSQSARVAALDQLILRVERARAAGLVGGYPVEVVVLLWDAMCCGLAMREICGSISQTHGEQIWTDALIALLSGLGTASMSRATATA